MSEISVEIDVRKAYTHAFNQIKEVPAFNQFDIWKRFNYNAHDDGKFHELTLFFVKPSQKKLYCSTRPIVWYMVCFLKHYADKCEMLYCKEPSRVYNVNEKTDYE